MRFFADGFVEIENIFTDAEWRELGKHRICEALEEIVESGYRARLAETVDQSEARARVEKAHHWFWAPMPGVLRRELRRRGLIEEDISRDDSSRYHNYRLDLATRAGEKLVVAFVWDLDGYRVRA
jgi:hypothetical protein